ncbi:MAG TPA: TIM barrel protein [Firmicutes bacterium]|nr:TIM barrel protein [Bacillota bacterium]
MQNPISVFTKPWKCEIPELAAKMVSLGVNGIELPVRPGYPVNPDNALEKLPEAAAELKKYGLTIYSVAAPVEERIIEACGAAGVRILRTMIRIDKKLGYYASVEKEKELYRSLLPLLERHKVTIGVQNHCDYFVGSALGLMHAIGEFSPEQVGAVLDPAHCSLVGEPEALAVEICWSHLVLVNLKNAFRMRLNGPEAAEPIWRTWWTTGRHGFTSWRAVAAALCERGYEGSICFCAEYSNPTGGDLTEDAVIPPLQDDLAYARAIWPVK